MEEIYQITSALKHLEFGREVAVLTDARFSGVSTGACIGHVGPEALEPSGYPPNGAIMTMRGGYDSGNTNSTGDRTVTYRTPFTTDTVSVILTSNHDNTGDFVVFITSSTGFQYGVFERGTNTKRNSASVQVSYIAIGY